jgi:peptidyl-prolyl cis-trans isomerase SurA
MKILSGALAILITVLGLTLPVAAQGGLTVVAKVNERVITAFELEQRTRFFTLLRAGSDPRKEALDRLIEERLQLGLGEKFGLTPSEEQVLAGMEEFAQRGQLTRENFLQVLAGAGVEEQTFRDFVTAGLIWREIVRGRFGGQVSITENDIDKALSATQPRRQGVTVQFAEIIMPADTPANRAKALQIAAQVRANPGSFSSVAREVSLSGTRERGGLADPLDLADMQPALATILLTLQPGEVSKPLEIPNAVAVFQLRSISETDGIEPAGQTVKYLTYTIPAGQSAEAQAEYATLRDEMDICGDLWAHAKGLPEERLQETTLPLAEVPSDVALTLAKLDRNELAADLTPAGNLRVVMLCQRNREVPPEVTRDIVLENLRNQRIGQLGAGYLAELRADANIVILTE